jgi:hypothetical protein
MGFARARKTIFGLSLAVLAVSMATSVASANCNPPKYASTYNAWTGAYTFWVSTLPSGSGIRPWGTIWTGGTDHTGTCNDFNQNFLSTKTPIPGGIGLDLWLGEQCVVGCPSGSLSLEVRALNAYTRPTEAQFLLIKVPETPGPGPNFDYSNTSHPMCEFPRPVINDLHSNGSTKTATLAIGSTAGCAFGGALEEITGWRILAKASSTDPGMFDTYGLRGSLAVTPGSNGSASGTVTLDCSNAALAQWVTAQLVTGATVFHLVGPTTRVSCQTGAAACSGVPNGTTCDDGDSCTFHDTCQSGACVSGTPGTCAPSDQCHTVGTCDAGSGICSNPPKPDGATCSDNDVCTQSDSCQAGACIGVNPIQCTAIDQCHAIGTCNPADGTCSEPDAPNGTPCDDGSACSVGDVCSGGVCGGTPIAPPPEIHNVAAAADKITYSWSAAMFAMRYDVVRGSLKEFPVGPGGIDEACFNDLTVTTVTDTALPAPTAGFWYLSRGQNACGTGTFGSRSNGLPRTTTTCP